MASRRPTRSARRWPPSRRRAATGHTLFDEIFRQLQVAVQELGELQTGIAYLKAHLPQIGDAGRGIRGTLVSVHLEAGVAHAA